MAELTVAKAEKEEFDRVWDFIHSMEALFDGRSFFSNEESWRDWPDEDKDKKRLLEIEKDLIESGDEMWNGKADNRLILYAFMKEKFLEANYSGSFGRILFDCSTLIENCCDPELDYLEFKPSIMYAERNAAEKIEAIIERGKNNGRSSKQILSAIRRKIKKMKED